MKKQHGRELTGQEMGQMLEQFINGAGKNDIGTFIDYCSIVTHRTLQQQIMSVCVGLIESWGTERGGSDKRNAATVQLCRKMLDATGDRYDRFLPFI